MLAHGAPLLVRPRHEVVINTVEEVMAVELVRAGVGLPVPLPVGAARPARCQRLPQMVAGLAHLAVVLGAVLAVGVGAVGRKDRAGDEAAGRRMLTALRHRSEEPQSLE